MLPLSVYSGSMPIEEVELWVNSFSAVDVNQMLQIPINNQGFEDFIA
jgi:hypothetical protein